MQTTRQYDAAWRVACSSGLETNQMNLQNADAEVCAHDIHQSCGQVPANLKLNLITKAALHEQTFDDRHMLFYSDCR